MAYIGKEPIVGNFQVCDAISVVNGQAAYTMQVSSTNVTPESANHMLVSLNGILQKPGSSFTISGSTITFASALSTGDVIDFIMLLGNVLDLGVPSDATVTQAKTNFVSTSSAAGLQIKGDGTTDGTLQLNCSQNSHGIKLKSPAHSAGASYTLTFPTTDGNADEFLQTNGSGTLTWSSAGGSYNLLQTQTVSSGVSSVDFTSNIDSTYSLYELHFFDLFPATDAQKVNIRFGAGSFDSGSNYQYISQGGQDNSGSLNLARSDGMSDRIILHANEVGGGSAGDAVSGVFKLFNPSNTTRWQSFYSQISGNTQAEHGIVYHTGGIYKVTSAVTRIQIFMSSGNIDAGVFKLYGVS